MNLGQPLETIVKFDTGTNSKYVFGFLKKIGKIYGLNRIFVKKFFNSSENRIEVLCNCYYYNHDDQIYFYMNFSIDITIRYVNNIKNMRIFFYPNNNQECIKITRHDDNVDLIIYRDKKIVKQFNMDTFDTSYCDIWMNRYFYKLYKHLIKIYGFTI